VAVYKHSDGQVFSRLCSTDVTMRSYTNAEIERYVASGDPLDKAGAYAIQHADFDPVQSIQGCFANVVGLPLCSLNICLEQCGLPPPLPIPQECDHTRCPFCQRIIEEGLSESS
jgi:predicted house-cleaning NTP pyrophosphatase (Maf/HAM1 superfamily)